MGRNGFDKSPIEKLARSRRLSSWVRRSRIVCAACCIWHPTLLFLIDLPVCCFFSPIYMFFYFLFCPLLLWFFSAMLSSSLQLQLKLQQLHLHPARSSLPAAAAPAAACATFEVLQVVKTFHVRKFCAHDLTSWKLCCHNLICFVYQLPLYFAASVYFTNSRCLSTMAYA